MGTKAPNRHYPLNPLRCENCRFFARFEESDGFDGECHARIKHIDGWVDAYTPPVILNHWCGLHEPNTHATATQ